MSRDAHLPPPAWAERRAARRIPLEVWVEQVREGEVYFQLGGNISEGGLYLERTIPHPVGTTATFRFTLPGDPEPVQVRGVIANSGDGAEPLGMGVRFLEVDPATRARIRAFVARHGDGEPAPPGSPR